jgi:thiamine-monophosphate kinase
MDLSETELLDAIRRVLDEPANDVIIGVGDDAAVVRGGSGDLVLTTDAMVQGTHFELASTAPRDLGAKAMAASLSDIAAMAASPRFALCALTLSDRVDVAWTMELFGGIREACEEHAVRLVGGNVSTAELVTVTVTVSGEVAPGRSVTRAGAKPEDVVVVTGTLGGAAAGLRLSREGRGWNAEELAAIRRHVRPVARIGEAAVLAAHGVRAMIDVSDGLVRDLSRLCEASNVGARLRLADVPVDAVATLQEALGGGEDYELVATLPPDDSVTSATRELAETFGTSLTQIGTVVEGDALVAMGSDGREEMLADSGWDHFRTASSDVR